MADIENRVEDFADEGCGRRQDTDTREGRLRPVEAGNGGNGVADSLAPTGGGSNARDESQAADSGDAARGREEDRRRSRHESRDEGFYRDPAEAAEPGYYGDKGRGESVRQDCIESEAWQDGTGQDRIGQRHGDQEPGGKGYVGQELACQELSSQGQAGLDAPRRLTRSHTAPVGRTGRARARTPQALRRRATLAALLLGVLGWSAPAAAVQAVRIGVGAPLSGPDAVYGNAMKLGVEQAVADLGAGFAGRTAVALPRDDQNDPKKGVAVAEGFIAEKVDLVVGHFSSAVTIPASTVYADAGALMVTPTAEAPLVTDRGLATIFRTCGRVDEETAVAARFLAARHVARIAVVHDRSGAGKDFADGVRRRLAQVSLKDVYYGSFERGARDIAALAGRLKAAKAELVVFGGAPADAGLLAKQLREVGSRATLLGGIAMASDEFATVAGPAADGALVVFPEDPRTRPSAADLLHRLQARGIEPDFSVFYSYAAVQVMAQAATAAGSTEPGKLAAVMHDGRTFATVLGDLAFDAKGDPTVSDYGVYVWHRGAAGRMTFDEQARS